VGGDVSGDEAVWRDLIARYEMPAVSDAGAEPWPDRENLEIRPRDPSLQVTDTPSALEPGSGPDEEKTSGPADGPAAGAPSGAGPATGAPSGGGPAAGTPGAPGHGSPANGSPRHGSPGRGSGRHGSASHSPGNASPGHGSSGNGDKRGQGAGADRTRVVRHASPIPQPSAADPDEDEGDDDRYVPPPPPPLPRLDSVGKGAWAALFGGPLYLVISTILSWPVSSWAALAAVTAFVGGFAVIVVRMGDGPSRGDGPDNGAVL
jgi:hypothetical protein